MVDFGDAPVLPADAARSHAAIEATVGQVLAAGAIPIVLGGDHSIAEPDIRACAAKHGPVGLVHFDTHADTGTEVFGVEVSHGTPMYRLVEEGSVDPDAVRADRAARLLARARGVRLAGGEGDHELLRARRPRARHRGGRRAHARDRRRRAGLRLDRRRRARPRVRAGDRARRSRAGSPRASCSGRARTAAAGLEVVGADVVEVLPTAVGSADVTALVAERIVREVMTGIALRRRSAAGVAPSAAGGARSPELPGASAGASAAVVPGPCPNRTCSRLEPREARASAGRA